MKDSWHLKVIGNASLILYKNNKPCLVCDPWLDIDSSCYFGSWGLSHKIPDLLVQDILECEYVWYSHGHPDHLNPEELNRFFGKTILIGDHAGSRIVNDLLANDYSVRILPDRKWVEIEGFRINCITNHIQDSALLIAVGNTVIGNLNDTGAKTMNKFIRREIRKFDNRILSCLSGFGDADLINLYVEEKRVATKAESNPNVIEEIFTETKKLGFNYFVPSSSFHRYMRKDTVWVQDHSAPIDLYDRYLTDDVEIFPAFTSIDLNDLSFERINPEKNNDQPKDPLFFGDNFSDQLEVVDEKILGEYFGKFQKLSQSFDHLEFIVGGRSSIIEFNSRSRKKKRRSVVFETPRGSLMEAVKHQVFDDLLISNIPKVSLSGFNSLYSSEANFNYWVCKFGDNGRAFTESEVRKYLSHYRNRAGSEFVLDQFAGWGKSIMARCLQSDSVAYKKVKSIYHLLRY